MIEKGDNSAISLFTSAAVLQAPLLVYGEYEIPLAEDAALTLAILDPV